MDNSKNFKFEKFEKFTIWKIQKKLILKFPKVCNFENKKNINFENSKNLQCGKSEKFAFSKILKISQIFQFKKTSNFWNCSISNNKNFSKYCNLKKYIKSNNSTFVISIFEALNFRNTGRSIFGRSKFWLPPHVVNQHKFCIPNASNLFTYLWILSCLFFYN